MIDAPDSNQELINFLKEILKVAISRRFYIIGGMGNAEYNPLREGLARPAVAIRSTLISRNVTVAGHRTSIRLEAPMWDALREVCVRERMSMNRLVTMIARTRQESSLTAAIRVRLMTYYREAATEHGHGDAGHGRAREFGAAPIAQRGLGDHSLARSSM